MKYLLLLILVAVACTCYGQPNLTPSLRIDTPPGGRGLAGDTLWVTGKMLRSVDSSLVLVEVDTSVWMRKPLPAKYDTISAILFYIDTAGIEALVCCKEDTLKDNLGGYTYLGGYKTVIMYDHSIRWQFGYEVTEMKWVEGYSVPAANNGTNLLMMWENIPAHWEAVKVVCRLDTDKKLLPKNIIVWQTISL